MRTVTGLFDLYEDATAAVFKLETFGVPRDEISIVANNRDGWYRQPSKTTPATETGAEAGAGLGAVAGGAGGLLAGLGLLSIPGVGPVVAAGWLVATVAGAAAGAVLGGATGGLIGALTRSGVPERDASLYVEGVRRGGTLVTARVNDEHADKAQAILREGSVDMDARRKIYDIEGSGTIEDSPGQYSSIPEERRRSGLA
jgi:hypothetical protein